jgi:hypothetical protein
LVFLARHRHSCREPFRQPVWALNVLVEMRL